MKFDQIKYDATKLIRSNANYDKSERDKFRKHTKHSNVVYLFYSKGVCVYIGESSKSLYHRCYKHENPHTDRDWFIDTDEVKIIVLDKCIDDIARIAIERTFILSYRPINNLK